MAKSEVLESDAEAMRELMRRYHDRVYRFGVQVCANHFDADDAVQQAFVTLSRRRDVQVSRLTLPWLFQVVRHACMAAIRWAGGRARVPLSQTDDALDVPDERLGPEEALERFQRVSAVHDALMKLAPEEREVIVLRDLEGLSGDEAARQLGISLAALKSRLHRARGSVRLLLEMPGQHTRR